MHALKACINSTCINQTSYPRDKDTREEPNRICNLPPVCDHRNRFLTLYRSGPRVPCPAARSIKAQRRSARPSRRHQPVRQGKVGQGRVGQGKGRAGRGRGMHRLYAGVLTISEGGMDWHFVCNGRPKCVAQLCLYAIQAGQQRTRWAKPLTPSLHRRSCSSGSSRSEMDAGGKVPKARLHT